MKNFLLLIFLLPIIVLSQSETISVNERWRNDEWNSESLQTYTYDNQGYWVEYLLEYWNEDLNTYVNGSTSSFINDSEGKVIESARKMWNEETNSWNKTSRETTTYNESGEYKTIYHYRWINNEWRNSSWFEYIYDENELLLSIDEKAWINNQWHNYIKTSYTYDSNGFLIKTFMERWDPDQNEYIDYWRYFYTNDSHGVVQEYYSELWFDAFFYYWEPQQRVKYTYTNNQVATQTFEEWSENDWINSRKDFREYNNTRLTSHLIKHWKQGISSYVNFELETRTYNGDGTFNQTLTERWEEGANHWVNFYLKTFYHAPLRIHDSLLNHIRIYPNPTNDYIYFSLPITVQLIDVTGKIVDKKSNTTLLDLTHHASGVYFLVLEDENNGNIQRKRIIKE